MPTPSPKPRLRKSKPPGRERELARHGQGFIVAGVDEVGRGAWAGPLVSAAVMLEPGTRIRNVRDSKLLTAAARTELAWRIRSRARAVGLGVVTIEELNRRGLAWSLTEAGCRAIGDLPEPPGRVLLDGHHDYLAGRFACETIIGGDATELCIAAASIIAKVHRDGLMVELHETYPAYGFAAHKGYGTAAHRAALVEHGPSAVHRSQWKPIQAMLSR